MNHTTTAANPAQKINQIVVNNERATEYEAHHFSTFASDLEFQVGRIPRFLKTTLGNGHQFELQRMDENGTAHYRQLAGCVTLCVFND